MYGSPFPLLCFSHKNSTGVPLSTDNILKEDVFYLSLSAYFSNCRPIPYLHCSTHNQNAKGGGEWYSIFGKELEGIFSRGYHHHSGPKVIEQYFSGPFNSFRWWEELSVSHWVETSAINPNLQLTSGPTSSTGLLLLSIPAQHADNRRKWTFVVYVL